ncbi:MAG: HAD family hydrolase [Caulobacteraceae bacterium]
MIHNVIFDLGNVLLDFKPLQYLSQKYGSKEIIESLYKNVFCSNEWVELDRGTLTLEQAIDSMSARNPEIEPYVKELMYNLDRILIPITGTVKLLEELKASNKYKLYLLSNFHLDAFLKVSSKYSFFKLFDGMVVSSYIKVLKPEPKIFEHLMSVYYLSPSESVFIDDVMENLEAAHKLGIETIHFTTPDILRKELGSKGILMDYIRGI